MSIGTRLFLQHHLNAMHLYCRMCSFMPEGLAFGLARVYERLVHRLIYR